MFAAVALLLSSDLLELRSAVADPLYVVRGKRGVVTFTSRRPSSGTDYHVFDPKDVAAFNVVRSAYWGRWGRRGGGWKIPKERIKQYDSLIKRVADESALDSALVKAVVHVESGFNSKATSHKGAMGLMQLMPGTARRFGVRNAYHPEENVKGGARYLRLLLDRYSGNLRLALAAYNAGEGAVDRYRAIPPYSETQQYVERVLATIPSYRCGTKVQKHNC